ncbi:MAG: PKD domain-containing protein [Methanolinea sp.]|nr:PKD domain-containing protein [Methanolinea sp.]
MSIAMKLIFTLVCCGIIPAVTIAGSPTASFSVNPHSGHAPLNVSFTDTSTGSPTSWAWYFGDEDYLHTQWIEQNGSAPWYGRFGHASVVLPDGSIIIMGGGGGYKNDVWRSSDQGSTWNAQNTSAGWTGREFHTSVALPDGSIVLMGGYNGAYFKDVWRSVDQGVTWTRQTASAPWPARAKHASVALPDGSIILMGGFNGAYLDDVWRSDDQGVTWTCITAHAGWSARYGMTSVVLPDNRIAIMGGMYDSSGAKYSRDLWISADRGLTWDLQSYSPGGVPIPRRYHSGVALPDGSILITGGSSSGTAYLNELVHLREQGTSWSVRTYSLPGGEGRYHHSTVALPDGCIVLMGGQTPSGIKNDAWRFSTANGARHPEHIYEGAGTYSVTLQVYDGTGSNSTTGGAYITVSPELSAPGPIGITPGKGQNTGKINITNLSGANFDVLNTPSVRLNRTGYPDILAGDVTTPSSSQITCTLDLTGQPSGLWNVVVENPDRKTGILENAFNITKGPPTASFSGSPTSGKTPCSISFTDTSTGSPTSWRWTFGDGKTSDQRNPAHTYTVAGTYTVALTVQNEGGTDSLIRNGYITVTAARPPVITSFSPVTIIHGKTINVAIIGNYFQKGATAKLVQGAVTIPVKIKTLTPPSKIAGSVTIPASARGKYSLVVTNPDGGTCTRANAITIT